MANRGKPLPFSLRGAIKERRAAGESVRAIAKQLAVSKSTVQKYRDKTPTN